MGENKSYFGKIVLLIFLSIVAFGIIRGVLPKRLFPEQKLDGQNIIIDSLLLNAMDGTDLKVDSIDNKGLQGVPGDSIQVVDTTDVIKYATDPTLSVDGYNNLNRFYEKLYKLEAEKKGQVRIAYFGDSMTDGDLIVQDIRSDLQDKYGGEGVGFVSITSLSASSRYSVSHQYSKNWTTQSYIKVKKPMAPFGIDGQVFFTGKSGNHWVKYRAQGIKHAYTLNNPTLFYGRSNNSNAYITYKIGKDTIRKDLAPSALLNTVRLSGSIKALEVKFHNADSIPFYGFNFDNGYGIHIDNYSMRGNSGLPLSVLSTGMMNTLDSKLGSYDLIILQYGANVLSVGAKSFDWYERNMTRVVEHLHKCFPNADILIISTADKATKIDEIMKTDPGVYILLKAQKNYARKTGSGFINLFSLMGGDGSMAKWVDEHHLAGKDYTHFTAGGAKKIAGFIHDELIKGYDKYKTSRGILISDTEEEVSEDTEAEVEAVETTEADEVN